MPHENMRRLVRSSLIVELDGQQRKLRHLYLFNDVLACFKPKTLTRERIDYELKWFMPLTDVRLVEEPEGDASAELNDSGNNIAQLKRQLNVLRDQLMIESNAKRRRKLVELVSQLVLATPSLPLRLASNKASNKIITFLLASDFERGQWLSAIVALQQELNASNVSSINALELTAVIVALHKAVSAGQDNSESSLIGDLHLRVQNLTEMELDICIELDSHGHYGQQLARQLKSSRSQENFVLELEGTRHCRLLVYDKQQLLAKHVIDLSSGWLTETTQRRQLKLSDTLELMTSWRFVPGKLCRATTKTGALFGQKMSQVLKRERRDIPFIVSACIREVERRGLLETGIYRISGSASDLAKLRKAFETDAHVAEQLLSELEIHVAANTLKTFLRELPEALFTELLYPRFIDAFNLSNNNNNNEAAGLIEVYEKLPQMNKLCIDFILNHLIRVHEQEAANKMSLHNLAMVFGPTLLRPKESSTKTKQLPPALAESSTDVMAQAGILYSLLQTRVAGEDGVRMS